MVVGLIPERVRTALPSIGFEKIAYGRARSLETGKIGGGDGWHAGGDGFTIEAR